MGWDQGQHLADATARAGLNLAELDAAIAAEPSSYAAEIEANHEGLAALPHWGVPTFGYNGEPFFGQDRIDSLCFQLEQDGLRRRPTGNDQRVSNRESLSNEYC